MTNQIVAKKITTFEGETRYDENPIIINNGDITLIVESERPIAIYERDNDLSNIGLDSKLNAFVSRIFVSEISGKRISIIHGCVIINHEDPNIVCYYQDTAGLYHIIPSYDLSNILLNIPDLIITNKGFLIFYTQDDIIATHNCIGCKCVYDHYYFDKMRIKSVTPYKNFCEVALVNPDDKNVSHINEDVEPDTILSLGLSFNMINGITYNIKQIL